MWQLGWLHIGEKICCFLSCTVRYSFHRNLRANVPTAQRVPFISVQTKDQMGMHVVVRHVMTFPMIFDLLFSRTRDSILS